MKVVVSEDARAYVKGRGGALFVRSHPHRCCHGSITLLDSTTERPTDGGDYVSVDRSDIDVMFDGEAAGPHEMVIELRGVFRRHPVAYWDGCAYKL